MSEEKPQLSEEEISKILQRVGPIESPQPEMAARVRSAVHASWQEEVANNQRPGWLRYAAAVAVIGIAAYVGVTLQAPAPQPALAQVDMGQSSLQISLDGKRWSALSDEALVEGNHLKADGPVSLSFENGINLRLDKGTALALSGAHEVRLSAGSLYFDSYGGEAEMPFRVQTPYGQAADIGTQFMVTSSASGWSVQVREGLVEIEDDGFETAVRPGQRLVIAQDNVVEQSVVEPHDESWRWVEQSRPAYSIDGRTIAEFLTWAARETGRELRYNSESARQIAERERLHGSIENLTADESLDYVLSTTDLELIESGEPVIMVGDSHHS